MSDTMLANGGPGFIGDLARMGGDVTEHMTNADLAGAGPGFWPDMARLGGAIVGPAISGAPVLTATENSAYAGFTVSAVGGNTPYVFSLQGTWPTGISINSGTGAVTGTPTEDGSFADLSVRVTDDDGETADLPTFTLVVASA